MWVRAKVACSQGTISLVFSMVPSGFGDESIKEREIATGRSCDPIAQWSEYSHGLRGVLGSCPGRVVFFSSPVTFGVCPCGSVLGIQ